MIRKKSLFVSIFLALILSINGKFSNNVNAQESTYSQNKTICVSDLSREINTIVNQSERQQENWGILIKKLDDEQILYQLNSNKYFIPASNVKLLTTAAALLKFGEKFQIKTPIYIQGESPQLEQLIIEGKGDPTITKDKLVAMAKQLQKKGITQINKIVLIDNYLPEPIINYSWEFSDIYYYYAVPINSLILEENTVTLTLNPNSLDEQISLKWSDELAGKQWSIENKGKSAQKDSKYNISLNPLLLESKLKITGTLATNAEPDIWWLAIPQPAQYFRDVLVKTLADHNITVFSTKLLSYSEDRSNLLPTNKELLLEFISPTLTELITVINQDSNNLYAEVLLKYLAVENKSLNQFESLTEILTNLGVSDDSFQLKDGSGLSRHNLLTPITLVSVLKVMNNSKYSDIFRESLSIAGINGTLKKRFKNTNITSNLYGKTGTLSGVSALSGYLKVENYDDLAFSIIVNQSTANSKSLRATIDKIILTLGQLKQCP